jgi:hypothetical protein
VAEYRENFRELFLIMAKKLELSSAEEARWLSFLDSASLRDCEVPPGGSTGEVLTKTSDSDWDTEWA